MDFWEYYLAHQNDEEVLEIAKGINDARARLVEEYPLERLKALSLEEYATGLQNKNSLCYRIEFGDLKAAGPAIGGGSAYKFGIYWDKQTGRYRFFEGKTLDSTRDPEEKWREIRAALVEAIESVGRAESVDEIKDRVPALKNMTQVVTKLAYCYYPEKMAGVSGRVYLTKILQAIGTEVPEDYSAVRLSFLINQRLREMKPAGIAVDPGTMAEMVWRYAGGQRMRSGRSRGGSENGDRDNNLVSAVYGKEKFLGEVFITEKEYDELVNLLEWKKNIILQGAPGVGKTFVAKRLAESVMGEKATDRVKCVQFHQSYGYEDFVEGYRPDGKGGFVLKQGILREIVNKARAAYEAEDDNAPDYYLIIDEINRGNLSKIFGELMMLMESDKRGPEYAVELPYSGDEFYLPPNLYIIGTMNAADRSLATIDYALRRRFAFVRLLPAFENEENREKLQTWLTARQHLQGTQVAQIMRDFRHFNDEIGADLGDDFKIGHSYVTVNKLNADNFDEVYAEILEYEVKPLLCEYYFDQPERVGEILRRSDSNEANDAVQSADFE